MKKKICFRVSFAVLALVWLLGFAAGVQATPPDLIATNLAPPVTWTPATNTAVLTNNQWRVTLPAATNGQRFFRLQSP